MDPVALLASRLKASTNANQAWPTKVRKVRPVEVRLAEVRIEEACTTPMATSSTTRIRAVLKAQMIATDPNFTPETNKDSNVVIVLNQTNEGGRG